MTARTADASENAGDTATDNQPFRRILIAMDGSHTGARALQTGVRLAEQFHARLAVVYVVNTVGGFSPQFAWGPGTYEAEYIDNGRKLLNLLTENLPPELCVERIVRAGDPAEEIATVINGWAPDLVIVGGPSHHRLGRLLLGSVDEFVLDHVRCCVLVLPPEVAKTPKATCGNVDVDTP